MEATLTRVRSQANSRGRPREFDIDRALDRAIPVFCERGFHGASLNDLADGMRLTQGSIYKAFKDKRSVFLAALDRQETLYGAKLRKIVDRAKSGHDKLRAALLFYVELSLGAEGMQGCLVVTTAVELASTDPDIAERVRASFHRRQRFLTTLTLQGQEDGSIGRHVDPSATAWLMLFLFQGLRVVGKTGVTRKELFDVVNSAMKTLS
ncbi:MAG: TetR/AcrR family transcriptional regulator [Candidatus Acidiferrum sp.]|jgi:TetR/AcrR family transcriptional repressor of nem operon